MAAAADSTVISSVEAPALRREDGATSSTSHAHLPFPPSSSFPSSSPFEGSFTQHESNGLYTSEHHSHLGSLGSPSTAQPVLVRAYSSPPDRESVHTTMGLLSPRPSSSKALNLPPVNQFSFEHVLQAVDTEINDSMDAIAHICARSKMSSADSYGAHLPPQGIITANPRRVYGPMNFRAVGDAPLDAVPEASSSSERLAGLEGSTIAGSSKSKSPRNTDTASDETELFLQHVNEDGIFEGLTFRVKSKDAKSISAAWAMRSASPTVDLSIVDAAPDSFSAGPPTPENGSVMEPKPQSTLPGTALVEWVRRALTHGTTTEATPMDAKSALNAIQRPP